MNLLQIHNKIPFPPKDGGSIAVYNLSEGFAKLNHNVHILSLNTKKHFIDTNLYKNLLHENIKLISVDIDTDIKPIKALINLLFSSLPYNAERFISEKFQIALTNHLNLNKYDIIQIEGLYMMPYIHTIRNNSKAIVSFRAHNIEQEIWKNTIPLEKNSFKRLYLKILYTRIKKFEQSYINTYDLLVPITEKDAQFFKHMGNTKKMHISPTGLESSKYKVLNKSIDKNCFFHLGSLDWIPNQEGLLWFLKNVWPKVIEKNKNAFLTIAGRNAPNLFIKKLSEFQNTLFLGEVENALEFIQKKSVMIVPLFSGSGMRIKIIEGMAAGNIVITTSKGLEGIHAQNHNHLLVANTKEEFIDHSIKIFSDEYNLQEISNLAQQFISDNFDNFAISKSLLSFYQKAIETNKY